MTTTTHLTARDIGGAEPAGPELLDVNQTAKLLGASPRHVYRLDETGRMPRRIRLGALVRWRRREIMDWIADGCPAVRTSRGGAA